MRIIKLLSALLFGLSLASCTFTENLYVNDDGSGKFSIDMDASSLMAMMPKDSLGTGAKEKDIDSTFAFKDILDKKKDSISKLSPAEQAKLKRLERFTMSIKMKQAEKQFTFSILTNFSNVGELQDAMTTMDEVQNLNKGKKAAIPGGAMPGKKSDMKYTYDGEKFTRKATINKKEEKKVARDSSDAYKMIYESSTYVIKYHFPKKVKKVSNDAALYSDDRKTITIEYPFAEYMDNPDKLNFEVEFE